ncbi:MAG: hypothetical protein AB2689_04950 [Candidatus Thiodiazotropha taylori]
MNNDKPVNSYGTGLERLRSELDKQLASPNAHISGQRAIVGWYLRYGFSLGYYREDLEASLVSRTDLHVIASSLSDEEIRDGKPSPDFSNGDEVEVIINGRNSTYHSGTIDSVIWHHKSQVWHYRLVENGKNISKRYEARDLRSIHG